MNRISGLSKTFLIALYTIVFLVSFAGCQGRGAQEPPQESIPQHSDSARQESILHEPQPQEIAPPEGTTGPVVAADFYIDSNNDLFYCAVDSNEQINQAEILNGAISVIPYAARYANNSISDIVTDDGMVYTANWQAFDNSMQTGAPPLVVAIENLDDIKKIVGCNLFLKNDNSLWTFTDNVFKYDSEMFPINAGALNWQKVSGNVEYAASSANGDIIVVKNTSGKILVFRGRESLWQDVQEVATDVNYCSAFFYPNNTSESGLELYYTDSGQNLYRMPITDGSLHESTKIDEGVVSFAAFYEAHVIKYANGRVEWTSGDGETKIQWEDSLQGETQFILSERTLTQDNHRFLIRYVSFADQNGEFAVKVHVKDMGEVSGDGI